MRLLASAASVLATLVLGSLLAACGSDGSPGETRTVTVVEKTVAEPAADDGSPAEETSSTSLGGSEDEDAAGASSGAIVVPNVVGKDHQLAQDTMQAAGLYNLSE